MGWGVETAYCLRYHQRLRLKHYKDRYYKTKMSENEAVKNVEEKKWEQKMVRLKIKEAEDPLGGS